MQEMEIFSHAKLRLSSHDQCTGPFKYTQGRQSCRSPAVQIGPDHGVGEEKGKGGIWDLQGQNEFFLFFMVLFTWI